MNDVIDSIVTSSFVVVSLIMVIVVLTLFVMTLPESSVDKLQLCQSNGYTNFVDINGYYYCYKLDGDRGQLRLVDNLEERK